VLHELNLRGELLPRARPSEINHPQQKAFQSHGHRVTGLPIPVQKIGHIHPHQVPAALHLVHVRLQAGAAKKAVVPEVQEVGKNVRTVLTVF